MLIEEMYSTAYDRSAVAVYVSQEDGMEALKDLLSPQERLQIEAFQYEKRRLDFLLSRAAAKLAIGYIDSCAVPDALNIQNGILGYPYCEGAERISISLSHSNGIACCIASEKSYICGIDVEFVDHRHRAAINGMLSENEKQMLPECSRDVTDIIFWTAHEAVSKILMTGMTVSSELYEVAEIEFNFESNTFCGMYKVLRQYEFSGFYLPEWNVVSTSAYPQKSKMQIKRYKIDMNRR